MASIQLNPVQQWFQKWAQYLVYIVIGVAIAVLMGWIFGWDYLTRVIPKVAAMNPLTALLFLVSGVDFTVLYKGKTKERKLGKWIAWGILIIALIRLLQYSLKIQPGIDSILFSSTLQHDEIGNLSNKMAANTAICFVLISLALILFNNASKRAQQFYQMVIILTMTFSILSLLGYIFAVGVFYSILKEVPMAIHTAFCFHLLGLALLFVRPTIGLTGQATSMHAGGTLARRLLPAIFLVPILLGAVLLFSGLHTAYGTDFIIAVFTLGIMIFFFIIIFATIQTLNKADEARKIAEKDLIRTVTDLKIRSRELEMSNKELESFSYSVSHDLRAPLRAINGYAEIILDEYPNRLEPEALKMLKTIARNGHKMGHLIDSLLNFTKLGKTGLNKKMVDMHSMAQETFKELAEDSKSNAKLNIGLLPPAFGDELLLSQLWQNLISNALKYSSKKESPIITISHSRKDNRNIYAVQDNGAGFDMKHYEKLFQVFHRLHRQDDFDGMGVGLSFVKKIIEYHQGDIWAEGEPEKGATFYFTLGVGPEVP